MCCDAQLGNVPGLCRKTGGPLAPLYVWAAGARLCSVWEAGVCFRQMDVPVPAKLWPLIGGESWFLLKKLQTNDVEERTVRGRPGQVYKQQPCARAVRIVGFWSARMGAHAQ